jgi:ribosomal protein L21E
MSKFKVGDRVSRVLCNGHTVRGMVESVYSKSIVVLGDNGEAYSILVDGTIKEDNMDEYKVTGEVIRKMAEKCLTARNVLKEGFPDAFKDEWMDITGVCRFSAQRSHNGVDGFYVSIDYSGQEIGWIEPWQFGIISDNFRLMRVDDKNGGCDCFRIEKKVR